MKRLLIFSAILLSGCAPKIVYVPTETIRTVTEIVHDTTIQVKLDVIRDSVAVSDTFSRLSNKYAYSTAEWHSGLLNHSLTIKDVAIPVRIQYVNKTIHDTTSKVIVQKLSKSDQNKLNNYDSLKEKSKRQTKTAWKLIGLLSLSVVLLFRKPIFAVIKKIIRPI